MSCFDPEACGTAAPSTPLAVDNPPGLPSLVRRVGTHASFRQAMLDGLATTPALQGLAARDGADPGIGLLDAWAAALDVLTFYQERIADEGYLGTAKERRSVLELARGIGYELGAGVAASAWLAATVEAAPGLQEPVRLGEGLQVQSTPGPDELPQTFETVQALDARIEWNAMPARRTRPQRLTRRSSAAWLAGVATNLKAGDVLLFVGPRREQFPASESWDARVLLEVLPDAALGRTLVRWAEALGHAAPDQDPAAQPAVHALRKRYALFGANAPDIRALPDSVLEGYSIPIRPRPAEWPDFEITTTAERRIDIDGAWPELVEGGWVRLEKSSYEELYRITRVRAGARTDFTLSGKTTQLFVDAREHLSWFPLRETVVHGASEALALADEPVADAVFGDRIELDTAITPPEPGRRLILRGRPLLAVTVAPRQWTRRRGRDEVVEALPPLRLTADDGRTRQLDAGQRLEVVAAPQALPADPLRARWRLRDASDGFEGRVDVGAAELLAVEDEPPAGFAPPDPLALAAEAAELLRVETGADGVSVLVLSAPLAGVYQRRDCTVQANVLRATHGARVSVPGTVSRLEPLGSGDPAQAMQAFVLRQRPLTYVADAQSPTGASPTLEVYVGGLRWQRVPTLYGQAPDARAYSLRHADDGTAVLQFGDGEQGARLPAGSDNVSASYRIGTGLAGQVRAGQLSLLMSRPLGLKALFNPLPATGAEDPETLDDARLNAPLTVLTLDRLVSVQDAADYARAFAGIGKARADVLWNGERRMIFLSLAAADTRPLDAAGELAATLRTAIAGVRPADQSIAVGGYEARRFGLAARVRVRPDALAEPVLEACRARLLAAFGFAARDFAQGTHVSELAALLQAVDGVDGVVIDRLDGRLPATTPRLDAQPARWNAAGSTVLPAQLLTLDDQALDLREML
ncbi:MAG: putative baseplate assembly protein [Burkholderiaceae bacterium]|nr:putative baseplate assembly protein [Burkholderiaceae bacterium]